MKKLIVMPIALLLLCGGCAKTDAVTPENEGENRAETQETVGVEKVHPEEKTTPYSANLELNSTTDPMENEGGGEAEERISGGAEKLLHSLFRLDKLRFLPYN